MGGARGNCGPTLFERRRAITGVRANTIPDEFVLQITRDDVRRCRVIWRSDDTLDVGFTQQEGGPEPATLKSTAHC
jgi:hypothetical protein